GEPQLLARDRRDDEIHAKRAGEVRLVGDHVQAHRSGRRNASRCRERVVIERRAGRCEYAHERLLERGKRWAADLDSRITPRLEPTLRITEPALADAQAADEADLAVHDDRLAMIARQPPEGTRQPRWIEHAHVGTRVTHRTPEPERAPAAEPIHDDVNTNASARALREQRRELAPDAIVLDDVRLEQDVALGARKRFEPGRKVFARVAQQ